MGDSVGIEGREFHLERSKSELRSQTEEESPRGGMLVEIKQWRSIAEIEISQ